MIEQIAPSVLQPTPALDGQTDTACASHAEGCKMREGIGKRKGQPARPQSQRAAVPGGLARVTHPSQRRPHGPARHLVLPAGLGGLTKSQALVHQLHQAQERLATLGTALAPCKPRQACKRYPRPRRRCEAAGNGGRGCCCCVAAGGSSWEGQRLGMRGP
jgi:hypothetical protein